MLPAAIPLAFQALIYKGLLQPRYGEIYALLSQLIGQEIGDNYYHDYSIFAPLSLLLCTILALIPLLTLWFSRLATELHVMSLLAFTKQLLLRSKPTLLLLLGVLMLAQPLYRLTSGEPTYDVAQKLYQLGLTDTLGAVSYHVALWGGGGWHYELASTLLLFILPVALLLGWWRYRALQQQPPLQSITIALQQPKFTGKLLPRLWLGAIALLLWLPLLLLLFISLRQGQYIYLNEGESVWSLLSPEFTLNHFKSAFNMTIRDQNGELRPPYFPFMQWLGNSLRYAGSMTLLTLTIALPAAWALIRYQFTSRQSLYRIGIMLQVLMPALLTVAIYHLVYGQNSSLHPVTMHMVASLSIVLLAIFPLTAALQQLGNSLTWRQALRQLRPTLLTLGMLLFLQQMAEFSVGAILLPDFYQSTLTVGMQQYLYTNNYYAWGDFAAAMLVLALPLMALFYWLVPRIDRHLINHWRPM